MRASPAPGRSARASSPTSSTRCRSSSSRRRSRTRSGTTRRSSTVRRDGPGAQAEGGVRRRAASAGEPPAGAGADRERPRRPAQPDGLPGDPRDGQEGLRREARATQPEAEGVEGRRRRRARADLRAGRRSQVATGQYPSKTRTKEMQVDKADPRAKLEPFQALIGEWTIEMTHPMVEDTVVRGRATYEWLEG